MNKNREIKYVKLGDNKFLLQLTEQGMTYQHYSTETVIKVGATEGFYNDWTAYFETPDTPYHDVISFGNKLPQRAAEELFPEWTKKGLKWRP